MASNSQISKSLSRNRGSGGKRLWLGICAAVALATVPVLPLKFLGIPGPDFDLDQVKDMGRTLLGRLTNHMPSGDKQKEAEASSAPIATNDVKLLDKTAQSLLKEISRHPDNPSLHNRLGLIYAELGELHPAVTHFEQAIKLSRAQIADLTKQSNSARQKGELAEASKYLLEISRLNVDLAAAHSSLARVYETLGQSGKVIAQLNELNKDIQLARVFHRPQAPAAATGRPEEKRDRLTTKSAITLARADAFRRSGMMVEASNEYKKLIALAPGLAIAHKELGMTALSMHNVWLAQEELKTAVRLDPRDIEVHNTLGGIYRSLGKLPEAAQEFQESIVISPQDANAAFNLGAIYAELGKYDRARKAFEKAVAVQPNSASAHNNLATMCSLTEDNEGAMKEFQKAITLAPNMASAHYGLGLAQMEAKDYSAAIGSFKKAINLNPALTDAHSKLELAYRRAGLNHVN